MVITGKRFVTNLTGQVLMSAGGPDRLRPQPQRSCADTTGMPYADRYLRDADGIIALGQDRGTSATPDTDDPSKVSVISAGRDSDSWSPAGLSSWENSVHYSASLVVGQEFLW